MGEVKIEANKNGDLTASVSGIRLCSAYSPQKEAERFVENLKCSFEPSTVVITGPCLDYTIEPLKKRFGEVKLCAVHYTSELAGKGNWDKEFLSDSESNLAEELYSYLGEEEISATLFCSWPPSEKIFADAYRHTWSEIKTAVIKSRNVLGTMTYFAKRWTENALNFCLFSRKNAYIQKGTSPVLICASGRSLETSIPYIKSFRKKFFLIALSSALSPLHNSGIIPDLILSTDGGYWAKKHLSFSLCNDYDVPLALPAEAACFKNFYDRTIVPLSYGDGCSEALLKECGYINMHAYRNGTVSGTAALFAMDITDGPIFFSGLDLAPSSGFAHTQPNELENENELGDFRLRTKETRIVPSTFASPALSTYLAWFQNQDFHGRVHRISDHFEFSNTLGSIDDVDWNYFEKNAVPGRKPNFVYKNNEFKSDERKNQLASIVYNHIKDPEWIKNALPADYVVMRRKGNASGTNLDEKMKSFCDEILSKTFISRREK